MDMGSMTYALVAHHYWNRAGGGQLVCAAAAKALEIAGFQPVLVSTVRIDVSKYPEWFGVDLSKYPEVDLGIKLRAFGIYLRLLVGLSLRRALSRYCADAIFTDECTYKGVSSTVRRGGVRLIEYVHFPVEASFRKELSSTGVYYGEDPYVLERYGKFPMNIYYRLYLRLLPIFLRENPFEVASLVLTNSRWTAELAKRVYSEEPVVLNPPIPPNVEVVGEPNPFEVREDAVVMVGRFSEEKRYHWVIEEVLPRLRREVPSVKLYVLGSTGTRTSRAYYGRLVSLASRLGLKVSRELGTEADVYLVENAPRATINEVMDRARIFLHATVNEHWGIAVAEAMARGLPVVVHRSGGTWSDLAGEGAYGLGYSTADGAAEAVLKLLVDGNSWKSTSRKSVERSKDLKFSNFISRLCGLVREL